MHAATQPSVEILWLLIAADMGMAIPNMNWKKLRRLKTFSLRLSYSSRSLVMPSVFIFSKNDENFCNEMEVTNVEK